jgi:HD-like signal output (HDOD) protein
MSEKNDKPESDRHAATPTRALLQRTRSLPPLPRHAQTILQLLTDPDLDMMRLAELVEQTPALAARIIGISNSAFFAPGSPVTSIPNAIIRVLGLNLVRDLGISFVLSQPFDLSRCPAFDPQRHWRSAMALALLTQLLAQRIAPNQQLNPSTAYLAGMLRNLGLLALVHIAPDEMHTVLVEANSRTDANLSEIEFRILGIDHTLAGAEIAAAWDLPESIRISIGPLSESQGDRKFDQLIALMLLSTTLRRCLSRDDRFDDWPSLAPVCRRAGIDVAVLPATITAWRDRLHDVDQLAAAFARAA